MLGQKNGIWEWKGSIDLSLCYISIPVEVIFSWPEYLLEIFEQLGRLRFIKKTAAHGSKSWNSSAALIYSYGKNDTN